MGFENNVFVNCPFDEAYYHLLRPLLFTIVGLGYNPRIASERSDSAENRIDKICNLVEESKYSIHDLSRLRSRRSKEFARMNMPFELGVDYGSRLFGSPLLRTKKFLILVTRHNDLVDALSDLSGVDVKTHEDKPEDVVRAVRNWFVETVHQKSTPSPSAIWLRFADFTSDFYDARKAQGYSERDLNMMPVLEYVRFIRSWFETSGETGLL
ncbi:MAG: hypothetical protein HC897_08665 [Thermoanaerobaculia bacterium]|nr:hypothetical protein [Thermoanaerobaculia bacterium]